MGKHIKYTKELLEPAVKSSFSVMEVMRKLGLIFAGGTHFHITKTIDRFNIDRSHFLRSGTNYGKYHKGGFDKLNFETILTNNRLNGRKEVTPRLRRAMIESGILHVCIKCGQEPQWQGKPLCLHIDHIDGNNTDNRKHNVRFLCPNCHSQTENFGSKNRFYKNKLVVDMME